MKLVIKDKNLENLKKVLKTGVKVGHEAELEFSEEGITIIMNSGGVAGMKIVLGKEAFEELDGEEKIRVFIADINTIIKDAKGQLEINDDNDVINLIVNGDKYTSPIVNEDKEPAQYPNIDYEGQVIETTFAEFSAIVAKLDKIKTEEIIFTVKDKKLSVGGVSQNRTAEITYKDINAEDFVVRFPRTSVMPILNKDSDKVLLSIKENTPLQTVCELDHISISYVCASFNK